LTVCNAQALTAATGMRGLPVQACLIAAPCSTAHSDALEQILQAGPALKYHHPIGLTLVDDILVVRALGDKTEPLLQIFTLLWTELRRQWLALQPCVPRIWATDQ
jgi:urease accessory protein